MTPPPNEVWLDAIMSKTKASESAGTVASSSGSGARVSFTAPVAPRVAISGSNRPTTEWKVATGVPSGPAAAAWELNSTAHPAQLTVPPPPAYQQYQTPFTLDLTADAKPCGYITTGQQEEVKSVDAVIPGTTQPLQEQIALDDATLNETFAMAMEQLVPEQDCCFVAKGLCHLCGVSESHYVPVVNFCPHANGSHSLCREHLRSTYGVRLEDLFAGRNRPTANCHTLRCMVCTRSCPCSICTLEKRHELTRYRRWLTDQLQASETSGDQQSKANGGKTTYSDGSNGRLSSNSRGGTQYPPGLTSAKAPGLASAHRGVENPEIWEPRDRRGSEQQRQQQSTGFAESFTGDAGRNGHTVGPSGVCLPSLQAQQKSGPSQLGRPPKRAAKEVSNALLSVVAAGAQAARPMGMATRAAAARATGPPRSGEVLGVVDSPSAAHVMNCAESEKSLVRLLNSLNQESTPTGTSEPIREPPEQPNGRGRPAAANPQKLPAHYDLQTGGSSNGDRPGHANAQTAGASEYQPGAPTSSHLVDGRQQGQANGGRRTIPAYRDPTAGVDGPASVLTQKRKAEDRELANGPGRRGSSSAAASSKTDGVSNGNDKEQQQQQEESSNKPIVVKRGPGRPRKYPRKDNELGSKGGKKGGKTGRRGSSGAETSAAAASARSERKSPRGRKPSPSSQQAKAKAKVKAKAKAKGASEQAQNEEPEEDDSDSELDTNLDYCEVCLGAGDLVCCDVCPRSFHLACLHMVESDLPKGDWQCAECKKPTRFQVYSNAVAAQQSMLDKCLKIVTCLRSHPFAKPFLTPVENVPLYTRVVEQPMDLSTIERKLRHGDYVMPTSVVGVKELNTARFADDVRLIWSNCKLFNDDGSGITRAAEHLSSGFEQLYKEALESPHGSKLSCRGNPPGSSSRSMRSASTSRAFPVMTSGTEQSKSTMPTSAVAAASQALLSQAARKAKTTTAETADDQQHETPQVQAV